MKSIFTVVVLIALLEVAYAFTITFRDPKENAKTVEKINPLQSLHKIIFGTAKTPKTTTVASSSTTMLSVLPETVLENLNSTVVYVNESRSVLNNSSSDSFLQLNSTTDDALPTTNSSVKAVTCQPETKQETSYLSDNDIRSKLCSNVNSSILKEYRYDLDAKVCSQIGKQSHCGKNMIFYSYARNIIYGHCDCDYSSEFPLIYDTKTQRCYFMYQQGYCGDEEWLEMARENATGICTKNTCYNVGRTKFGAPPLAARDMPPEYVPLRGNGPCVKLNQPNSQYCENKGDVVTFRWPFEFYPNCGQHKKTSLPDGLSGRFLGEVSSLECNPGSYLTVVGSCEPEWDFD